MTMWSIFRRSQGTTSSYEKALKSLAERIHRQQHLANRARSNLRRYKGLYTFYTALVWMIYTTITITMILHDRNISWSSWTYRIMPILMGPLVIMSGRRMIDAVWSRIIKSRDDYLLELRSEQRTKLEELKSRTNFNSTKSLLDMYERDATPVSSAPSSNTNTPEAQSRVAPLEGLSGPGAELSLLSPSIGIASNVGSGVLPPPGAVNELRHRKVVSNPVNTPPKLENWHATAAMSAGTLNPSTPNAARPLVSSPSTTFPVLPTNFVPSPPPGSPLPPQPRPSQWYDRVLDLIVGDDETSPSNRFALICKKCHSHNGLLPPGDNPSDVKYTCPRCGYFNEPETAITSSDNEEAKDS